MQTLVLLLFLYLLVAQRVGAGTFLPGDLFFHLDPLAGLASILAFRSLAAPVLLGLTTIALALAVGRAWCSWMCPLGTLLDWTSLRRFRRPPGRPSPWRQVKYLVLLATLLGALLGTLGLLIFDPVTILFRTLTSGALPGINIAVTRAETYFFRFDALRGFLDGFDSFVRGTLLPEPEPYFVPSLALVAVLAVILAANAIRPRFWCRYLCPLGALLGLVSRASLFRRRVDQGRCTRCRKCASECPANAIDAEKEYRSDPGECTLCLRCLEGCPARAIAVGRETRPAAPDLEGLTRRHVLGSFGLMLAGVALLRLAPLLRGSGQRRLRPPGSSEEDLMSRCLRCGICVNVCPTRAIHPAGPGPDGDQLWTPALVPRLGYCDYTCQRCGEACPTGAIPALPLPQKQLAVIGKARIDTGRCLPWSQNINCIVCQEMCPLAAKAIELEDVTVATGQGQQTVVRRPVVLGDRCIGCGLCEHQCPLEGEAAIRVYPDEDGGRRWRGSRA